MTASRVETPPPPEDPRSDRELVAAFQDSDEDAFVALVERYKHRLFRLALSVVRNDADADDVVQDALIKAYHGLAGFRRASKVYTWLYRIVMNQAIDYVRRRPDASIESTDEMLREVPDSRHGDRPDSSALNEELTGRIFTAIDGLPEKQRRVILLREVEGMSYRDIADTVGCSEGTVMSRLYYARERVREELGPYLAGRTGDGNGDDVDE